MHGPPADLFADLDPQRLVPVLELALELSLEAVGVLGSSTPRHACVALTAEPSVATDVGFQQHPANPRGQKGSGPKGYLIDT